jgi:hypothetical protein
MNRRRACTVNGQTYRAESREPRERKALRAEREKENGIVREMGKIWFERAQTEAEGREVRDQRPIGFKKTKV